MDLKFKRTMVDKVQIKGLLSEDGMYITYKDEDKEDRDIKVADLLNAFKNCPIEMTVMLKSEEDLDVIPED